MEKKIWTAPEVGVVQFQANEYVAGCVMTTTTTYTGTCWDSTSSFNAGSSFYLFGDSDKSGTLNPSATTSTSFENPLYSSNSADEILQNYGAGNSALDGDYAIFNSVMWSGEPHRYNPSIGYNGLASGESHELSSDQYNALYNGYVVGTSDALSGSFGAAETVKYMFDSATNLFHLFTSFISNSFTSKNSVS